jgi:predicted DNA-binding transcriptional regulator YafY
MSKISNVLTMLELLSNNRKYSIKELADVLEVSERMIRVYKEDIEKAGIYIDTKRGPYGGYVLNQSIRIPYRKFTIDDYRLLQEVINQIPDIPMKDQLTILADKVHGIYQGSKEEKQELSKEDTVKYNIFCRAIKEKRKVKILYYSYNKGENARIIRPYDMFLFPNGWGVAAFCEEKQDLRHFELKRIRKCDILAENFE